MAKSNKFLLLLWKNWLLQKRKKILTVFEVLLPVVFAAILLVVRMSIGSEPHNEPTVYNDYWAIGYSYYSGNGQEETFQLEKFSLHSVRLENVPDYVNRSTLTDVYEATNWDENNEKYTYNATSIKMSLCWTPDVPPVRNIMTRLGETLNLYTPHFENETAMVEYLKINVKDDQDIYWGGIVFQFEDPSFNETEFPEGKITYKIRMVTDKYDNWMTGSKFPQRFETIGPRAGDWKDSKGSWPDYHYSKFTLVQHNLDREIIRELKSTAAIDSVGVKMQLYPYPDYIEDQFITILEIQMPFLIMFSFIVVTPNIVKDIVLEKEKRLKEFMKLMGLSSWLHWAAWFFKYFMFMLIATIIMTIMLSVEVNLPQYTWKETGATQDMTGAAVNYTDPSILFLVLFLYSLATITFCFAISTLFNKANAGAAAGGIAFFLTYVPFFFIQSRYYDMNFGQKIASCLLHNLAMAMCFTQIGSYESLGSGVQWSNIGSPANLDDDFTILHCIGMLIFDIFFYTMITWYIDEIKPGQYGLPKPFYFPFTSWYWCGSNPKAVAGGDENILNENTELFEPDPEDLVPGIKIRGLKKAFKKNGKVKLAVAGTNLNIFNGEITALLGHNGAGKTTTMNVITGFLPPTEGTAYINGYDIRTDLEKVRQSLGLCPQHNILFDTMTVEEHLLFYGKLKGLSDSEARTEITSLLQMVQLEDKRTKASSKLSGGMKRKLHVCIALIGNSNIVILDEPTSGLDPEARRQIWNLLQQERANRTMILSTHFMDEADLLGDRIAIMAEGVVQCAGSSMFLKNKFGVGYHMVMVKADTCNVDAVTGVVKKHVPDAKLESNISAELSYILPRESSSKFQDLFSFLEQNKNNLGIMSFGASVTTMEEVFMKVGESVDETLEDKLTKGTKTDDETNGKVNMGFEQVNGFNEHSGNGVAENRQETVFGGAHEKNTALSLYAQQFYGMFVKRVIHSWRNRVLSLSQIIIPVLFTILACVSIRGIGDSKQDPPMTLSLKEYRNQIVPYDVTNNTWNNTMSHQIAKSYDEYLKDQVSVTRRVDNVSTYVLDLADKSMDSYNKELLVGGSFMDTNNSHSIVKAYYNGQPYHPPALTMVAMDNALLRYFTGTDKYEIETINYPLPKSERSQQDSDVESNFILTFIVSITMMFGMSFLVASFVVFIIKERSTSSKHLQFVSGVHALTYWFSTFAWDFINFMIPAALIMCTFWGFNVDGYVHNGNWQYTLYIFLLYAWSSLPFTYLLSNLFSTPASGYVWTTVITLLLGIGTTLAVMIMSTPGLKLRDTAEILRWIFYAILPHFCFGYSIQDLLSNTRNRDLCQKSVDKYNSRELNITLTLQQYCDQVKQKGELNSCCPESCPDDFCSSYTFDMYDWASPGLGRPVLFMSLQGLIFFGLILFGESGIPQRMWQKFLESANRGQEREVTDEMVTLASLNQGGARGGTGEDQDVAAERNRVHTADVRDLVQTDSIIIKDLEKFYGRFLAVDRLSLGIKSGECFGLLGVNGAGKTSTFKMLTGEIQMSSGDAYLDGFSVKKNITQVQQRCGYCPQFDALIDQMTVQETLTMYARLRGVQEGDIKDVMQKLIANLLLEDHANKFTKNLSGGNKRKLSTAISLIGDPPVVFLDEPTTGMDPVARRLLWDTLTRVRTSGRTLVLTSHSMEECEALCTRMAIMVNGKFCCLGSSQHLKSQFGEGYSVICKVLGTNQTETAQRLQALLTYLQGNFPNSRVVDVHQGQVHYQIKESSLTWAQIFGLMESIKEQFFIEDYSVSQTTLEQVFLNFARAQRPPREEKPPCCTRFCNCCRFVCGCCGMCCKPYQPKQTQRVVAVAVPLNNAQPGQQAMMMPPGPAGGEGYVVQPPSYQESVLNGAATHGQVQYLPPAPPYNPSYGAGVLTPPV